MPIHVTPAQSVEELLQRLGEIRPLSEGFFGLTSLSAESAILASVDKSTIRAYHHTKCFTPSSIYRSWAHRETRNARSWGDRLSKASEGIADYQDFHSALCESLRSYWGEHDKQESVPNYGRARKLVDLFMKHSLLVVGLDPDVRKKLKQLIHVPLDKYTLKHISGVSSANGVHLPRSRWTMGAADENNYLPLQALIHDICQLANVAPIDFDIYAWNAEHPQVTQSFIETWTSPAPAQDSGDDRLKLVKKSLEAKKIFWKKFRKSPVLVAG